MPPIVAPTVLRLLMRATLREARRLVDASFSSVMRSRHNTAQALPDSVTEHLESASAYFTLTLDAMSMADEELRKLIEEEE